MNDSCINEEESEEDKMLEAQGNKHKIDMRNMLGFLNQNLYHDYLNITNIMKLKRLDFRDVYGVRSPDLMLTRENIIERIMLLITAYFCMGTELRFLKQMKVENFTNTSDAEFWHGRQGGCIRSFGGVYGHEGAASTSTCWKVKATGRNFCEPLGLLGIRSRHDQA